VWSESQERNRKGCWRDTVGDKSGADRRTRRGSVGSETGATSAHHVIVRHWAPRGSDVSSSLPPLPPPSSLPSLKTSTWFVAYVCWAYSVRLVWADSCWERQRAMDADLASG
jgi:hypothetical protein